MSDLGLLDDRSPTRVFWFRTAAASHPGTVRRVNEDAWLDRGDVGLWAVADGMGGHDAGDVASRRVVAAVEAALDAEAGSATLAGIRRALEACNAELQDYAAARSLPIVGSTVVVLVVDGRRFECAWAGDSRLYLLRAGQLAQVTRDHSRVQELVDRGELDPRQAENHAHANVITRAVGALPQLELDAVAGEIEGGDVFLLCSDGLTRAVGDTALQEVLAGCDPGSAAERLLALALAQGARDNVTLVIVGCEPVARRT
ncbi:PP2C family protein-serine/threonine phosphatase [Arenibaculum pallidiluteum]|uniref:PP2C family protein-serine/threonine phosphatase n=1 Tax=Arenibaculum pallidiluteum TaxID=2812559 RepID=UPI001A976498|nr:protein phosphatase 2C domain-containing protein [Arenibaculum pallidiluteum]